MDRPERRYQIHIKIFANSKDEFVTELQDLLNTIDLERGDDYLDNANFVGSKFILHTEKFNPEATQEKYDKEFSEYLKERKECQTT